MAELYRWESTLLENYAPGDLIAVADSADEARKIIRAHFDVWAKESRDHLLALDDADAQEWGIPALRRKLEADLAGEPAVGIVLYISGSD